MMKHEFEALAGYEVSHEDYTTIIEPMYMSTNLSKEEFVRCIDKKRFARKTKKQIITAISKEAKHLKATCENFTDYESINKIRSLIDELSEISYGNWIYLTEYSYPDIERGCTYPCTLRRYINNRCVEEYKIA